MKLDIQELHFVKVAVEAATIKASDAPLVAEVLSKLDKEFVRLQAQAAKDETKLSVKKKG